MKKEETKQRFWDQKQCGQGPMVTDGLWDRLRFGRKAPTTWGSGLVKMQGCGSQDSHTCTCPSIEGATPPMVTWKRR